MILNTAFEIVRENGMEKLNNREIAKRLNCSIRPIYYQFKNVEEMQEELYQKIEKFFYQFLLDNMVDDIPKYKQVGINYIKFAKKEKTFFKFYLCLVLVFRQMLLFQRQGKITKKQKNQ